MSDHESEDERIAAFLDGRMDARRRDEMLAHLSASEEDRRVLAGTAAILRELEEAGEIPAPVLRDEAEDEAPVQPDPPHPAPGTDEFAARRSRTPVVRWLLLAAVLAGIAFVGVRALRDRGGAGEEPVRLAARLEHAQEGLPAGWTERRPWTSVRGDPPGGTLSAGARAASSARAGAMLVDLAVAVEARDAAAARVLAIQLAARFDPQSPPLDAIRNGAGADPERLRPLVREATERIGKRLDGDALRIGAWTEAAGLAAARRDAAFFRDDATAGTLDRAEQLTDPAGRAAARQVRDLLASDPPPWEVLAPALDALARELATE